MIGCGPAFEPDLFARPNEDVTHADTVADSGVIDSPSSVDSNPSVADTGTEPEVIPEIPKQCCPPFKGLCESCPARETEACSAEGMGCMIFTPINGNWLPWVCHGGVWTPASARPDERWIC